MKILLVLLLLLSSSSTKAVYIGVSSQPSELPASAPLNVNIDRVTNIFGSFNFTDDIEIRFNSAITYDDARLSNIDSFTEMNDLWFGSGYSEDIFDWRHPTFTSTVNMFIVDNINIMNFIGFAQILGNTIVLEEGWLGSTIGANLFAHELGHNMGLRHFNDFNIMNPIINFSQNFRNEDINTINMNLAGLIQFDGINRFVEINPIFISNNISPSPVPIPPALWLFGSCLIGLMGYGKKPAKT